MKRRSLNLILILVLCALLLVTGAMVPQTAQAGSDGRINNVPWVNGWGAVAVYCVDKHDQPASNYDGGIKILSSSGQRIFFAANSIITAALNQATLTHSEVKILTQGHYTLSVLPGPVFKLVSNPDSEGKTFIGMWSDCTPVNPGPDQSAPSEPMTCDLICYIGGSTPFSGLPACVSYHVSHGCTSSLANEWCTSECGYGRGQPAR